MISDTKRLEKMAAENVALLSQEYYKIYYN